jgi:hypothetical protein
VSPPLLPARSGVPACQRPSASTRLTGDALGGPPSARVPLSRAALAAHGPTIWQVAGGGAAVPSPLTGNTPTRQQGRSFGTATHLLPSLPQRPPLSTRSIRAPPSTLPCPAAARVRLVRQHPPFPRLLCSFSRPRSSFPSGDDRACCVARCSSSDGRFAGDEHPTGVCLPIPLPSHPAARNQTPKPLTYGICIQI